MFTLLNPFALKRALAELRALRRAVERIADVLELQAQVGPRAGQTFRGFSRERQAGDGEGSGVSYVDPREAERVAQLEPELSALLGRAPTAEELERALAGEVE